MPSASASRCAALPGRSGLGCDSCGAQPCRKSTSKLAATRPVGSGEALAVDLRRAQERGPPRQAAPALDHQVALAHGAEVAHQGERIVVLDLDGLAVGHRQGEARALQQARRVAQIGERRDARAQAALDLAFGRGQGLAQLPQRGAAQHGAQQQAVGPQDALDLHQGAGQVVDPMEVHGAHDQVEALGREGQEFLVRHDRRAARQPGEAVAEVGAHQPADGLAVGQCRGELVAVRAEIERMRKGPAHVVEAVDQAARDLALEEGARLPITRSALAPPAQHGAVENQQRVEARHTAYVRPKRRGR